MVRLNRCLLACGLVFAVLFGAVAANPAQSSERRSSRVTDAVTPASKVDRLQPHMKRKLIPFSKKRMHQMARYSKRHYGQKRYKLKNPRMIVEHYTDGPSMMSAWWTMANNSKNLGEYPGVCAHFIINKKGTIYRVVPTNIRCRHTIGLNQTSIGIEHVGYSSKSVFSHKRQRQASYRLTLWLMAKYDIAVRNVIGHGESLYSPLRYEKYKSWRCMTHVDFSRPAMHRYRHAIRIRAKNHGLRIGPPPHWVNPHC